MSAPSELTGTQATPEEDAQTAGLSATGLAAITNPMATARGIAGGFAGTVGGGKGGHYLGGIPGRVLHSPLMEKQGEGYGEGIGAFTGGVVGSVLGAGGLPLKAKVAGVPLEVGGETPPNVVTESAAPANVEEAYRRAGLHTPYSSAQETGTWHAGQGAIPSPYETDVQSLASRMRSASPARPSTFKGIEIPGEAPAPRPTLADRMRSGEVMQQGKAATSRSAPTSELAPSLWSGLDQPVVEMPGEPGRAGLEYQMGEGQPDEATAIREAQRAKLEQKGRR